MTDRAPPPPKVFFIRHGETDWSLSGRHTGKTDIALTLHGEEQARALRPWVAAASFSRVLTSPRQRARQTCELSGASTEPGIDPDLAERDYGDYEGRRSADICNGRPGWDLYRD
jgi:broad specificity phosphatase PhoE